MLSFFLFECIPGSTTDHFNAQEINASEQNTIAVHDESIPLFYFSIFQKKATHQEVYALCDFIPEWKWNGTICRYHTWLRQILHFDFGYSSLDQQKVNHKLMAALNWTLAVQVPCYILLILIALSFSYYRTLYRNSIVFRRTQALFMAFHSIPVFWVASLLVLFFANGTMLKILPANFLSVDTSSPIQLLFTQSKYFVLPILSLLIPSLAYVINIISNGYDTALGSAFWKRVKASGIDESQALKNEASPIALIPFVTWTSSIFPALIAGSLLVENIFAIPGMGRLFYTSIQLRDWSVVHAIIILSAAFTLIGFIISDVMIQRLDPRIKSKF